MTQNYRGLVAGLAEAGSVEVNGEEYTGSYLAMLVAITDSTAEESVRTVQLIAELGRLTALAYREKSMTEARYRAWRDGRVWLLTNGIEEASKAGFACASAGIDAKGKAKEGKCPSVAAAETYIRTIPEYMDQQTRMASTEEAWATMHVTLEAARQRTWALKAVASYEGGIADDNSRLTKIELDTSPEESIQKGSRRGPPPPPTLPK